MRRSLAPLLLLAACMHAPPIPGPLAAVREAQPHAVASWTAPVPGDRVGFGPTAAQQPARVASTVPPTAAAPPAAPVEVVTYDRMSPVPAPEALAAKPKRVRIYPRERKVQPPLTAALATRSVATPKATALAEKVAAAARHYLTHNTPREFRTDCSGFVCAVMDRAGVALQGNTRSMWGRALDLGAVHHRDRPQLGDLVFFDNTYDRNGNARLDDDLTHIGVVMAVEPNGTVVMANAGVGPGKAEYRLNLRTPGERTDADGNELNSWLRRKASSDRPGTRYLAGELWRGFATVRPADLEAWLE